MEIKKIDIEGPLVITPQVFHDSRGYFYEPYNKIKFINAGITDEFLQDNQSLSQKGAVRGLHFQSPPFAQGKLVRVVSGAVLDVILDIRKLSPTYGQSFSIELNAQNKLILWVPIGFAHGFATLEDNTLFQYKCTEMYNKASEGGILWNSPSLKIDWHVQNPILSDKDLQLPDFEIFETPFV